MGSKNHEVVPTTLIAQISGLRGGSGVHRCISNLAKVNLIAKVKNAKCIVLQSPLLPPPRINCQTLKLTQLFLITDDGYRLTYGGLDYLALHTHLKRKDLYSVGNQIGVGKESDIFVVASSTGTQHVLKIHRLGRISFRTVKANRDYLRNRASGSWMYMSRLAALKEFTFMKALKENGFPVPEPLAQSRHTIVMSLIDAFPLRQISSVPDPASLYAELINMILRIASFGLIHGDFNEFNILIEEKYPTSTPSIDPAQSEPQSKLSPTSTSPRTASITTPTLTPILIDFPQMLSIDHPNAEMYFDRDVNCIKRFFQRRFHFTSTEPGPFYADARKGLGKKGTKRLDVDVQASGFSKKMAKELEAYMREVGVDGDREGSVGGEKASRWEGEEDDEDDEEDEEDDEDDEGGVHGGAEEGPCLITEHNGDEKGEPNSLDDSEDGRGGLDAVDGLVQNGRGASRPDSLAVSHLDIDDKT